MSDLHKKKQHRILHVAIGFVLLVCLSVTLAVVFADPILNAAGRFLTSEDDIRQSDILFVPSGYPRQRFEKAIDLMKAGVAGRILINFEAQSDAERVWEEKYGSAFSADRLITHMMDVDQLPEERVIISKWRSVSTEHDFAILRDWLNGKAVDSVIVVTSGKHLRRCRLVVDRMFDEKIRFWFVAADDPNTDQYISRGKRALDLFIAYMKLAYYYIFVF